jgi:hypothetical protein
VLQVPLEALVDEPKGEGTRTVLWVIDAKRWTISKRAVTVQVRNLTDAVIAGVPAGALVVSLPQDSLKAGMRVRKMPELPGSTR